MDDQQRRAVLYGLIVAGGFVAVDVGIPDNAPISGSYCLGAIVAGVLGGFIPALPVSTLALALTVASGGWNHDFGSSGYFAGLFVSFCGALLALGAGRLRDDNETQLARQELLGAVADLPAPGETLEQTLDRVVDLLVPRYANHAAVEGGAAPASLQLASRGTRPVDPARLVETRLVARGRDIGCLRVAGGRAGGEDPRFLRILAGRVALALDNAGLSQELVTVEQQLQAILENLGEAVTVQDPSGRLVFANKAAAELLGAESVEELLSTPPQELMARYVTTHPDNRPVELDDLPGRAVLEGREAPPLLVRTRDAGGREAWRLTKATAVRGPDGRVRLAVNVIEDVTEAKRAELAQRLLSDASAALASSLDYKQTLQMVADLAVPEFADWCVVSIPDGPFLDQVAVAHSDPAMREFAAGYAERYPSRVDAPGGAGEVFRTGRPMLVSEVVPGMFEDGRFSDEQLDELRRLGLASLIVVPMSTPERVVGTLSLLSAESARRFEETDLEVAAELARRAATAIENARLYTQLEDVATTLQRSLLPPELPVVPGWSFRSLYMPAGTETDVGGDFYDVFPTAAGWMAVMGDVVGRGAAAASLTAMARYTLRTAGSLVGTPTMGLARLNDNLRQRGDMALCTAGVVLLRDGTDDASLVLAGHPQPFLVRRGEPQQVGRTGPLLGAFESGHWLPVSLSFEPGDVLVLFTDGVIDARGADGRFGDERLAEALAGVESAEAAVERIRSALFEFAGDEQDDDTAVLALQKL